MRGPAQRLVLGKSRPGRQMSELKRRLFKVVGDAGQSESSRPEPIEEIREGIAQLLKQTRERYGQSLRDVSANLRIRMAYLQAIENGRFRELPGPTYAVGFVRSYAEYLGLDAAEIVRRFKGEVEGLDHRTHLAFPEPVPEGKVPGGAIIIISLLVLVIGYGGWYAITSRDADGTGLIPRISENLKSLVGSEEPPVEVTATPSATSPAPASAPSSPDPAAVAIVSTPAPVSVPVSSAPVPLAPQSGSDTSAEQPAAAPATSLGAGENASAPHVMWGDRRFGVNETIALELAGACRRYHAGLARTMQLGKPGKAVTDTAAAVLEGMEAVLDTVKPGVTAEAVHAAWNQVIGRYGLKKESRIGYAIGIGYPPDWGEHTISLRPDDRTILEPSHTVHCILGMWMEDWGLEVSETILITETGAECLTNFPRELFIR